MSDDNKFFDEFNVSRETIERFTQYVEMLKKWNKKINLISASSEADLWNRHISDSAQLMYHIKNDDIVFDIGSGAGFPGFVIALMGVKNVSLVESDNRKSVFLLNISKIAPYNIRVINDRIENIDINCDVLTSRALASVLDILELCKKACIKKKILLLKGENVLLELEEAKRFWDMEYTLYPSSTNSNGAILEITSWTKKNDNFRS